MKKLLGILVLVGVVVGGGVWMQQRAAAPGPEGEVRTALVRPASEFEDAGASVAYFRDLVRRQPEVARYQAALAQALMQQAKSTGQEAHYLPQAQAALDEVLRREPGHVHARALQAALLNALHRFEEARDLSEQLLREHPSLAYAYGTLVDALAELGAYEEAVAACDRLLALRPDLSAYARAAYLRELHGDAEGARAAMRLAADAGVAGHESRAWALHQLGLLYLGAGRPDTAAFIFDGILDERPGYAPAVAGLGQVRLAQGAPEDAIALLEEAYALAPHLGFLESLAEAQAVAGDVSGRRRTLRRIQQAFWDAEAMGENVNMEYADFLADEDTLVEEALARARREYQRRPEHLHVLETYAWTLYKNGLAGEAVAPIEQAMRLGTGDAMVHFRAARIYAAAGRPEAAAEQFAHALAAHLHVESPTAATEARAALERMAGGG